MGLGEKVKEKEKERETAPDRSTMGLH